MISRIIRISLIVALLGLCVWQFWVGNWGNGIFLILLDAIVIFTYFKNEWMIMTLFAMRKNDMAKAERYLLRIKDPDRALVRSQRASYYFLMGAINAQRNISESERMFRRSLEIGLSSKQERAMAKLQLSAIAMQKGRKKEAEVLLSEAKKLDTGNLLDEQIGYIKQGLKRAQQPSFFQQQQARGVRRR